MHHGIEGLEPGDLVGPAITPASVYFLPGEPEAVHQYGRWTNPTWSALEQRLSILEDAETVVFPSGMAAIASLLYSQLQPGDAVLLPSDGYYGTRALAERYLAPMRIEVATCPTRDYGQRDFSGFRLVWIECPSNPGLDVCDIREAATRCRAADVLTVADNTTLTPLGQRPLDLGVDVLVCSDTKCANGHSDTVFGHVSSRNGELMAQVRDWRCKSGVIPGAFEAWLVHRGLESLEVRFDRMCSTAEVIAQRLAESPSVIKVSFPGLPSHPGRAVAERQMLRFGQLIGVTFSDAGKADCFINNCPLIRPVTSFGGIQTSAERRARWGDAVEPGFVRLSVGCEPVETLWTAMEATLRSL